MKIEKYVIDNDNKERLDLFVLKHQDISRSQIKSLIENGNILVNDKIVKAGYGLRLNDIVTLQIPENKPLEIKSQNIPINIVYEDADLLVINKPQGMVVHPACGNYENTLVNALLYNVKDLSGINGVIRPGIVHRLDKNTSGLMLVAKNDKAHISLSKQIQDKTCFRNYIALVNGHLKEMSGHIETFIARDKKDRKKMAVSESGKLAITNYKVLERFEKYDLVEYELKTGRTHQIRVHSKYLGHTIVGDDVYGHKKNEFNISGQLLHAYKISFVHPTTNQRLTFECELPTHFHRIIDKLKRKEKSYRQIKKSIL